MTLASGTRIGGYEVVSALGAGGMGEVYRATDTKLHRDVALKILPDAFTSDPERLARFRREAQVLASLNHPHIGHIYGFEDTGATHALVMELVEGEDLSALIARGSMPLADLLPIARQIAEALEGAHEQGIVHRDLKPANIKVRPDGAVKVLDFGLAKAIDPTLTSSANVMNSPTLSLHATQAGLILGTAAYMSPEQARGRAVDKRSDLWAFGCVLFEMLTGRRAFGGDDITDTIVAVVSKEPDWTALPAGTPPSVRRLLMRSLEKEPKRRLDSAAAARLEIDEALAASTPSGIRTANDGRAAIPELIIRPRSFLPPALPWALAVIAAGVALFAWRNGAVRVPSTPTYASLEAPAGFVLGEDDPIVPLPTRTPIVFTPDGRSLVIQAAKAGKPQLFLRSLDRPDGRPIAGTDDARVPFVSPDGKWVGFWTANEIRKVPIEGGAATTICAERAPLGPYGASWSTGDVIVFGDEVSGRVMRVPANGGTPAAVTGDPGILRRHSAPFFLPDGKRFLYSDVSTANAGDGRLMVQSIDGGAPRLLLTSATDGRLLPSKQLAFMRLGTLMTIGFDAARAETKGDAVAALGSVMQSGLRGRLGADGTGAGMFAVSSLGALVVIRGAVTGSQDSPLIWVDRGGRATAAEPDASSAPRGGRVWTRISPDGSRVLVAVQTPIRRETWILDWTRDLWTACDSCLAEFGVAIWSPDGRRLVTNKNGALVIHTMDNSAPDQELVREEGRIPLASQWLPDGRIVYESTSDLASFEIKVVDPGSHTGRIVIPMGGGAEPQVSPDGRWLAYTAPQNGEDAVIVQAFPGPGSRTQVSGVTGSNAAWSGDGRTLFYLERTAAGGPSSVMKAVDIRAGSTLDVGKPRELFRRPESQRCGILRCYDLWPDGSRFLLRDRTSAAHETVSRFDFVLNWTATLPANR
jgi:Tol biopolymer transport system component